MKDEQFIQAMQTAVEQRGRDFRFDRSTPGFTSSADGRGAPMYQTPEGEGACLLGYALLLIDKAFCPPFGVVQSGPTVLRVLGFSDAVQVAGGIAQIHQDAGYPWGQCLDMFMWMLENKHLLTGIISLDFGLYHQAYDAVVRPGIKAQIEETVEHMKAMTESVIASHKALDELLAAKPTNTFANGGFVLGGKVSVTLSNPESGLVSGTHHMFAGDPAPSFMYEYASNKQSIFAGSTA